MAHEATKTHECKCEKSWADIQFDSAELESDGRLALTHDCGKHEDETCVHLLSADTAKLIKTAVGAG